MSATHQDRAIGAIMGAFVGEALGVGPHWYYDLKDLRRTYGDWIDDYTTPEPGRFHHGLKAGQNAQAGFILELMLRSLVERDGYDEDNFCQRLGHEFFRYWIVSLAAVRARPDVPGHCQQHSADPEQ